jgi:hypothetical protein
VVKSTAFTDEKAALSGRQLSYAEAGAAYAGVVAGRPVKEVMAGMNSSAPLPTKKGASQEGKGGRDDKASLGTAPVSKSPREEKDVTVETTAGGYLDAHPAAPNKPSGTLKPTAKVSGTAPVPATSTEAAQRHKSPGAPCDVSGPLSIAPTGTTSSAQVVEVIAPGGATK